jgi:hypothetical protein
MGWDIARAGVHKGILYFIYRATYRGYGVLLLDWWLGSGYWVAIFVEGRGDATSSIPFKLLYSIYPFVNIACVLLALCPWPSLCRPLAYRIPPFSLDYNAATGEKSMVTTGQSHLFVLLVSPLLQMACWPRLFS